MFELKHWDLAFLSMHSASESEREGERRDGGWREGEQMRGRDIGARKIVKMREKVGTLYCEAH